MKFLLRLLCPVGIHDAEPTYEYPDGPLRFGKWRWKCLRCHRYVREGAK